MSDHRLARIGDFEIGQRATFSKTVGEADMTHFVAITGDVNPIHIDEEFAKSTFFGERIVHGVLSGSLISTIIGTKLPGTGAIYRAQSFEFLRPVHVGDTLTAWVEVTGLDEEDEVLELATGVDNQREERVIRGKAEVGLIRER